MMDYLKKRAFIVFLFLPLTVSANQSCIRDFDKLRNADALPANKIISLIKDFNRECKLLPDYKFELASYYGQLNEHEEVRKHLKSVYDHFVHLRHEAQLRIGSSYLHEGKLPEAELAYSKVIELKPKWDKGYEFLGTVLVIQGEYDNAISTLHKGLQYNDKNSELYKYLGFSYHYKGRPEEAINYFDKAFSLDESLLLDLYVISIASKCFVDVGKPQIAESLLTLLANNIPEVEKEKMFADAVLYWSEKNRHPSSLK